jgi:lipoate-protein ligase A
MNPSVMNFLGVTLPSAVENVALDEALLVEAEENGGPSVLRIWELDRFAVVLGASCRLQDDVFVDACQADGVEIARRSSGGGTVVIGRGALNCSVILPIEASVELKGVELAQKFILDRILQQIRREGIDASMLGSGDLTLNARKFSGSAQRRLRHHVLVHASFLYDFPLDRIDRYLRMPPRRPAYRQDRPHSEFIVNLPLARDRLIAAIRAAWLVENCPERTGVLPESALRTLIESKFSKIGWIERL